MRHFKIFFTAEPWVNGVGIFLYLYLKKYSACLYVTAGKTRTCKTTSPGSKNVIFASRNKVKELSFTELSLNFQLCCFIL